MKADRAKLLESSITIKANLERRVQELRSKLTAEEARFKELEGEFWEMEESLTQTRAELTDRDKIIAELRSELADLKQKSATTGKEFPDDAEVYNQFKAENPKAKATYKEIVAILATAQAMIEKF